MAEEMREAAGEDEQELAAEMAGAFLSENLPENVFGAPKAGAGMWASCIRVLDPINGETVQQIPLEQNEAALRLVTFEMIIFKSISKYRKQLNPVSVIRRNSMLRFMLMRLTVYKEKLKMWRALFFIFLFSQTSADAESETVGEKIFRKIGELRFSSKDGATICYALLMNGLFIR